MRSPTWGVAVLFIAACGAEGAGPSDAEGDGQVRCPPLNATSIPSNETLPLSSTEATYAVGFDGPITFGGPVRAEGAEASGSAEGAELTVRLTGLGPGQSVDVVIPPGAVTNDCGASTGTIAWSVEVDIEPWRWLPPAEPVAQEPAPPAEPFFVEVSEDAGFGVDGVDARAMLVDFDGDGFDDIVTVPVTSIPMNPRLYRNLAGDGGFGFEEVTERSGMSGATMTTLAFGDLDNDGDQDAVSLIGIRSPEGQHGVWTNDGTGVFTFLGAQGLLSPEVQTGIFHEPAAVALTDLDGDGLLDLYVGHWYVGFRDGMDRLSNGIPTDDQLYRNVGGAAFEARPLPEQLNPLPVESNTRLGNPLSAGTLSLTGRAAYGRAVSDFDGDGDPDIFVNNYGAGRPAAMSPPRFWDHNFLWRNDSGFALVDVGAELGLSATARGIRDVQQESTLTFQGIAMPGPIGGNGFGAQFFDFDQDADMDLISATIAHPDYPQSDRTMLWVNDGAGAFTEESLERGLLWDEDELHPFFVDIDQDGRPDLAMSRLRGANNARPTQMEFYLQNANARFDLQPASRTGVEISRPNATLWTDLDGDGQDEILWRAEKAVEAYSPADLTRLTTMMKKFPLRW